jgi:hypothetical protein
MVGETTDATPTDRATFRAVAYRFPTHGRPEYGSASTVGFMSDCPRARGARHASQIAGQHHIRRGASPLRRRSEQARVLEAPRTRAVAAEPRGDRQQLDANTLQYVPGTAHAHALHDRAR